LVVCDSFPVKMREVGAGKARKPKKHGMQGVKERACELL